MDIFTSKYHEWIFLSTWSQIQNIFSLPTYCTTINQEQIMTVFYPFEGML